MKSGFVHIIEALLVITLMFAFITALVKQNPPTLFSTTNIKILERWSSDMRNMVCGSEQDKSLILTNSLSRINSSLNYVSPQDMRYKLIVLDTNDNVIGSTGHATEETDNLASTGCVITNGTITRKVVIQTWY